MREVKNTNSPFAPFVWFVIVPGLRFLSSLLFKIISAFLRVPLHLCV